MSDMSDIEFNEGDLVEAVKGESVVRGRLRFHENGKYRYIGDSGAIDQVYLHDGWTVTVIEKATPKVQLPTEPGFYATAHRCPNVFELVVGEQWWWGPEQIMEEQMLRDSGGPLTRLAPVPVTARKVLDRVADAFPYTMTAAGKKFDALYTEFGVTC